MSGWILATMQQNTVEVDFYKTAHAHMAQEEMIITLMIFLSLNVLANK